MQETWVLALDQEDPLEKEMEPIPVLLPGESHRQRNLVGYSPWGLKEPDTTEATWQALEGRRQHSVGQHLCSDAMDHCCHFVKP